MTRFRDKLVLVTGSGRGIGREIALRFAREGAHIVVNFFRNREPAEETAVAIRQLGQQALVVKANMGNLDDIKHLYREIETNFGGLDILVHNAASGYNRPALEQKTRGWEWTMNINARSLLFGAQQAVPLMQKRGGGAIVAVSSLGSQRVMPDYIVVGTSKAALESLVRYLGAELAPYKIVVNAVSPGVVLTEALTHFASFREEDDLVKHVLARTPIGRLCTPEDIADVVTFLCSSAAQTICGQTIIMDGGHSLLIQ
ncbi:MAG: enoyl-[acyl-carrier-protein] reductase FabL [Ardenticatenaceae bacterium]|nr:enoyl-[acyl-carrier-protein] reductase FabL [Ardenticatenaceae bacterium]MCB9444805.1 enoyl-[acyl-carrier-protein] reductase FabL [Ardenticatenaceae bacterium]